MIIMRDLIAIKKCTLCQKSKTMKYISNYIDINSSSLLIIFCLIAFSTGRDNIITICSDLRSWCKTIVTTLFYISSYNIFAPSPQYVV